MSEHRYVPDKQNPFAAAVRKDMADVYRKMRADGHGVMARLLRRRMKIAADELARQIWFVGSTGPGAFSDLI